MTIILIIMGIVLIYFASRPKKDNGKTLIQVATEIQNQPPGTAVKAGFKYLFRFYAKTLALVFGVLLIVIGLIFMAV